MRTAGMKTRARNLRAAQTMAEAKLWFVLKGRWFCNDKFRRQRVFGPYIVDFICLKKKLIIELDGVQHLDNKEYDENRTRYIQAFGFRVLRFWNHQVLQEFDFVLETIYLVLQKPFSQHSMDSETR